MDIDLILVVGLVVGAFAIPSLVNAFSERRWPRTAFFMIVISALMIATAVRLAPGIYSLDAVPDVFVRVVGRYLN